MEVAEEGRDVEGEEKEEDGHGENEEEDMPDDLNLDKGEVCATRAAVQGGSSF